GDLAGRVGWMSRPLIIEWAKRNLVVGQRLRTVPEGELRRGEKRVPLLESQRLVDLLALLEGPVQHQNEPAGDLLAQNIEGRLTHQTRRNSMCRENAQGAERPRGVCSTGHSGRTTPGRPSRRTPRRAPRVAGSARGSLAFVGAR